MNKTFKIEKSRFFTRIRPFLFGALICQSVTTAVAAPVQEDNFSTLEQVDQFTAQVLGSTSDVTIRLAELEATYPECRLVLEDWVARSGMAKVHFEQRMDAIKLDIESTLSASASRLEAARARFRDRPSQALRRAYRLERERYQKSQKMLKERVERSYPEAFKDLVLLDGHLDVPTFSGLSSKDLLEGVGLSAAGVVAAPLALGALVAADAAMIATFPLMPLYFEADWVGVVNYELPSAVIGLFEKAGDSFGLISLMNVFGDRHLSVGNKRDALQYITEKYRPIFSEAKTAACVYVLGEEITHWFKAAQRMKASTRVVGNIYFRKPKMVTLDLRQTLAQGTSELAEDLPTYDYIEAEPKAAGDSETQ
jgi:hypothetical protein